MCPTVFVVLPPFAPLFFQDLLYTQSLLEQTMAPQASYSRLVYLPHVPKAGGKAIPEAVRELNGTTDTR